MKGINEVPNLLKINTIQEQILGFTHLGLKHFKN